MLLGLLLVGLLLVTTFWDRMSPKPVADASSGAVSPKQSRPPIKAQERRADPLKDLNPTVEEFERMMESPIEFYGKVVDQDDRPLVGIEVRCSWNFMNSVDGLIVKSAAPDGRFEVKGRKSMEMHFGLIPPEGYRITETSQQTFLFADYSERLQQAHKAVGKPLQTKHLPDPANPVVFRIRKIGPADVLHKVHQGTDRLPRDGSPRYYSFSVPSAKGLAQPRAHSVEVRLVSEKEPDDNSMVQASWSMRIRVPGGGLQQVEAVKNPITGDYDELNAPEAGYQEEMAFEFPKSMPKWQPQFVKEFFFRFPDNTYARATIGGDWKRVRIQSLFNPSGSRNLLFDETKVIELKKTP